MGTGSCRVRWRADDYWRWQRGGYSVPRSRVLAGVQQRAFWRIPPIRGCVGAPGSRERFGDPAVVGGWKRTAAGHRQKPFPATTETSGGRGGRGRARGGRKTGDRKNHGGRR